ncbi:hypothetical protein, partial [Burkholderia pseudomallei]|uniref:hypothetical protein n=1 Tax=Burkholderia pseudomallei TaxID=28450 RepID=UPI001955BBC2
ARAFERRLARDVVHARVQDQLQVIVERARARRDRRGRDGFGGGARSGVSVTTSSDCMTGSPGRDARETETKNPPHGAGLL